MVSIILYTHQTLIAMALALLFCQANGMTVPGDTGTTPAANDTDIGPSGNSGNSTNGTSDFLKLDFNVERGSNFTLDTLGVSDKGAVIRLPADNIKAAGDHFEAPLKNHQTYYLTDIYIGSNKQKISVDVDTGSSDLWVVSSSVSCSDNCQRFGAFNSGRSSSYRRLGENFRISYGDQSYATGTWASDDVSFVGNNGAAVRGLHFGDVDRTTAGFGILGVGLTSLESTGNRYPNMPALLAEQGVISKNAYSLYLNSPEANQGSIIFGGVDNAKYSGSLSKFPVTSGNYLSINMESVSAGSAHASLNRPVLLDSGTTLTYLSPNVVDAIGRAFGGTYNSNIGAYVVDCNPPSSLDVSYNFGNGFSIKVPAKNLVNPLQTSSGYNSGQCFLGIFKSNDNMGILGDNFLRSAYVVYDLDGKTISLAPVKYTSESNISAL